MKTSIAELKAKIEKGKFPLDYTHFAGTNLIITNDENYHGIEDDIVICTPHAGPLSWMVFQMKEIFKDHLNQQNKYEFYPAIGDILRNKFKQEGDLIDIMLFILTEMEEQFSHKAVVTEAHF